MWIAKCHTLVFRLMISTEVLLSKARWIEPPDMPAENRKKRAALQQVER